MGAKIGGHDTVINSTAAILAIEGKIAPTFVIATSTIHYSKVICFTKFYKKFTIAIYSGIFIISLLSKKWADIVRV